MFFRNQGVDDFFLGFLLQIALWRLLSGILVIMLGGATDAVLAMCTLVVYIIFTLAMFAVAYDSEVRTPVRYGIGAAVVLQISIGVCGGLLLALFA